MPKTTLSLGAKLWVSMVVVVVLLILTLVMATARGSALTVKLDAVAAEQAIKIAKITRWAGLIETNVTRAVASVVSSDPVVESLFKDQMVATTDQIGEIRKSIEAMELAADDKAALGVIRENGAAVLTSIGKARAMKAAGDQAGAVQEIQSSFLPAVDKYAKGLSAFSESQAKGFEAMQLSFVQQRIDAGRFAQGMVSLLVLILVGGTVMLIKQIREPLQAAIAVAETIASGDLSVKVDISRGDEFGHMMKALAHMRDQLAHLVTDVRRGTEGMSTASQEIATGNQDLADRTEQTAANLEKAASSMEQLTATVKQSADSAQQANQLASSAAHVAQRGGQVVNQVVATMEDINISSRKISDIISVIDGIAFQTNILALNAAVEAARAGEQGRGFAVVASEVRSLAGRSADAAKEIKSLINASVEKVEGGSRLVADAGQTMTEIVSAVQRVTDIMGEISSAAAEQFSGITEVNGAVSHLDQMTQQNAALVEESAAAAANLRDQADGLARVVAAFKLDGSSANSSASPRSPAPKSKPHTVPKLTARATPAKSPAPKMAAPAVKLAAPKPSAAKTATASKGDDDWETF